MIISNCVQQRLFSDLERSSRLIESIDYHMHAEDRSSSVGMVVFACFAQPGRLRPRKNSHVQLSLAHRTPLIFNREMWLLAILDLSWSECRALCLPGSVSRMRIHDFVFLGMRDLHFMSCQ